MKTSEYLVSVILPVYNGEKFLKEAINSILNQSFKNFELIIINDASKDRSLEIINDYVIRDERIFLINNKKNEKLPKSLNIGHRHARGNFITWTSDDNILEPNFIHEMIEAIIENNVELVFSDYRIIDKDGNVKREVEVGPIQKIFFGNIIGASFMYDKSVFLELGGYNPNLFLAEDYDFFLRASLKFKFHRLDKKLYYYRVHENNLTTNIQNNCSYCDQHIKSISKLFMSFGRSNGLTDITIKHLTDLFLQRTVIMSDFLKNKDIIKKDLNLIAISLGKSMEDILDQYYDRLKDKFVLNQVRYSRLDVFKHLFYSREFYFRNSRFDRPSFNFLIRKILKND